MILRRTPILLTGLLVLTFAYSALRADVAPQEDAFQDALGLSIESLEPLPRNATNWRADDPLAAELGRRFFFDARFSASGKVSCSSCHQPQREFQDGVPLGRGVGTTDRRTMPIAGTAYSPFLFWDGRKDSLWAQALGPLESPVEHGGSRGQYAHVIASNYRAEYEQLFGPLPDLRRVPPKAGPVSDPVARASWEKMSQQERNDVTRIFVNLGKAIAAYERRIQYGPSRFDAFVSEWKQTGSPPETLSRDELAGFALFRGKANCIQCHNGPLFTNNEFHNTGVPERSGLPHDEGRVAAIPAVLADEFNCSSRWSDARPHECRELEYLAAPSAAHVRAFKVPSLRNVAERAPYMHAGQFATLAEVIDHYNRAPAAPAGTTELQPLGLSATERAQLEAFLRTLSGGISRAENLDAPAAAAQTHSPLNNPNHD